MSSASTPESSRSDERRSGFEAAHRELGGAITAYEKFLGGALESGQPMPIHDAAALEAARARVEAAERELWRLREAYLGWSRPSWAPSASLEAEWFSDEDAVCDEVAAGPTK